MRRLAEGLLGVALAAARVQMSYFNSDVAVERKADHSPVTAADRQSEEIILRAGAACAGGAGDREEEVTAGRIPASPGVFPGRSAGRHQQLIMGASFTINIALIEERRPVFGLVYAPALADFM